jgi:hypothetical protein
LPERSGGNADSAAKTTRKKKPPQAEEEEEQAGEAEEEDDFQVSESFRRARVPVREGAPQRLLELAGCRRSRSCCAAVAQHTGSTRAAHGQHRRQPTD